MTTDLLTRIRQLAGSTIANATQAEFGGCAIYITPPAPEPVPPRFAIKGRLHADLRTIAMVNAVAACASLAAGVSGGHAVVEVETRGLGDAYIDALRTALAPVPGVEVVGVLRIADAAGGVA